ncbi:hypothetical protein N7540_006383 [Penicillium herquei]|nr:hypothetical protein N7540_006383 [Penicillium herquei]
MLWEYKAGRDPLFQGPKAEEYIDKEDTGQEIDIQPPVMLADALRGLRGLITFHEQQETPDIAYIKRLRQDEIDMQRKEVENRHQSDIWGHFRV